MKILGLIPARGGSKGIPGKNITLLAGKPLIGWTLEAAHASARLSRVIVSTDDPQIAEVAAQCGADVPFLRPSELATDSAPVIEAVEFTLRKLAQDFGEHYDAIVLLQPTSPLRATADIDAALELALNRNAPALISVCEASPHPWLARTISEDGSLGYLFPGAAVRSSRQDYPPAFMINGAIYFSTCESLLTSGKFQPPGTIAYQMPAERSLDIDNPWELKLAELLLQSRRGMDGM